MQVSKDTPTTQITIQKQVLSVPRPFDEGHVCTEAEASALNQTLSENIRNNLAAKIKNMTEQGKTQEDMQAAVDEYVAEYEFGKGGGGRVTDPIEKIAVEMATQVLVSKGMKKKDAESKAKEVVAANKYPQLREEAAKVFESRNKAAAKALGDLAA